MATSSEDIARYKREWQREKMKDPEYREKHNARRREYKKRPHVQESLKKQRKEYYEKNREKELENNRQWRLENAEKYNEICRNYWRKNPGKMRSKNAARKAAKSQRTVSWADREAINFFYECCPAGCHVDHIIPLRGDRISGLHVENNLQWLPVSVNCSKGNSFGY